MDALESSDPWPWLPSWLRRWLAPLLRVPPLSVWRIAVAVAVAAGVDAVQLALGPAGWGFADELLDVGAMLATIWLLGFHPLLLPTFALEVLPVVDVLPTWTGCVGLVVARRRRARSQASRALAGVTRDACGTSSPRS